ncbi:hypothetical protein ABT040_35910 [Streptomyces sp. NPDC002688]|uniref:hypothetical protein n=1 Tax=Streptomyces sp. NPDC002688 TaxID=3154423 RepID=UPI00332D0538
MSMWSAPSRTRSPPQNVEGAQGQQVVPWRGSRDERDWPAFNLPDFHLTEIGIWLEVKSPGIP